MILIFTGCVPSKEKSVYIVEKFSEPIEINSDWEKESWKNIPALHVNKHMGEDPDHKPKVQVKVAYDNEAIYVIFRVEDQYVKCIMDQYLDPVSRDSTVEFFFTPGDDISKGYFNLEVNCGGTALFKFQKGEGKGYEEIPESVFGEIDIAHSLPRIVYPEIKDPITWTIEYRIPVNILSRYYDEVDFPAPGVEWKANFYKIADDSSHPHWLTWSHVDHPEPRFHLPQFFGTLRFK
ncbi:MAG: carbohydrate-binding family 9-like protein [Flavobacteriaceae bacterium]|nr:carbohydrate-binding family 9-like protein [Flavobacteriaceae bacterium]